MIFEGVKNFRYHRLKDIIEKCKICFCSTFFKHVFLVKKGATEMSFGGLSLGSYDGVS